MSGGERSISLAHDPVEAEAPVPPDGHGASADEAPDVPSAGSPADAAEEAVSTAPRASESTILFIDKILLSRLY